jgi:hypothetical protein
MSLIRPSHSRFSRRSRYTFPELRDDVPRVTRRIHLITGAPQPNER